MRRSPKSLALLICLMLPVGLAFGSDLSDLLNNLSNNGTFDEQAFYAVVQNDQTEQKKYLTYQKLRTYYCEVYFKQNTDRIISVEQIIDNYFSYQNRLGYFTFCAERGLANPYLDAQYANLFAQKNGGAYNDQDYAADIYRALKAYRLAVPDYQTCADLLDRALTFRPNDTLYETLCESLKKTQNYARLFEREAYRSYDRQNASLKSTAQLYLLYRKIRKPAETFSEMTNRIKNAVLSDVKKSFVTDNLPEPVVPITDSDGNQTDLTQLCRQTKLLVLLFSVTCHNCIDEMNAVNQMRGSLRASGIDVCGVYVLYNDESKAADELRRFNASHGYDFACFYESRRNAVSDLLQVTSVPTMLLCDAGQTVALGHFAHYGHLSEKINAVIGLFDDTP